MKLNAPPNVSVVLLGHGSIEDARLFASHIEVPELVIADQNALDALPVINGGISNFLSPKAIMAAFPIAWRSLRMDMVAKLKQPLPGHGNFRVMGGQFLFGPGDELHFSRLEDVPGAHLTAVELEKELKWN